MINIIKLVRRFIDSEMKVVGVTRTGWQVLFWLRRLNTCTQKELLQHMDIDAAQLARVLDDFEKKNYISRRTCKEDRRCLSIEMTDFCRKTLLPHVEKTIAKEEALLSKDFSEKEKATLKKLLEKLEKNLEEVNHA